MGSAILGKALQDVRPSSFCNVVFPISRVLCYPPPKSPSCEGDLFLLKISQSVLPIPQPPFYKEGLFIKINPKV